MSTITTAFEAGDLPAAIAAVTAEIKAKPRESGLRWLMSEMLLFSGEIERADRALDAVIADEPSPAVLEFRKLLRAEEIRRQVFREGRVPKFQGDEATPAQTAAMRALTLSRQGDAAGAAAAAAEAESLRPRIAGSHNDTPFDDLRDADDIFAPMIEILTTAGEYMWVPVERLASLEFEAPRRPRDLYWRRCRLELKDSTEGVVYMPVVYPWSDPATEATYRLGRATDWPDPQGGPQRGLGQRLFLAGEDAVAGAELGTLRFT